MLEECVSDHGHERMTMEALPGSSLEVIQPEFPFQLLMGLFADRGSQRAQIRLGGQICEIIFLLSRRPVFADEPGFVPRKMLLAHVLDPLRWSIGGPYANSGEASFQPTLGPVSPTHFCHLALASMSSAGLDRISGMCRLQGRPRPVTGPIGFTSTG